MGAEQEYFLVDRAFYHARPDLVLTGRTLIGAPAPRATNGGNYFGAISDRVFAFMEELELEALKLGIPLRLGTMRSLPANMSAPPNTSP